MKSFARRGGWKDTGANARSRPVLILCILGILLLLPDGSARAQDGKETSPTEALTAALVAACRQKQDVFELYLPAESAIAFRALPASQRTALMQRLVAVGSEGSPILATSADGRAVLRCGSSAGAVELRFGPERVQDSLAFIPVEIPSARNVEFGLVREGKSWRLLSVGLLLLHVPELAKQWAAQELQSREERAIAALHDLADAIKRYRSAFGSFPENLAQLGPRPKEGASPDAADLVDEELSAGKKFGYAFRYRILPGEDGGEATFELAAAPAEYPTSGRRSFFLDAAGTLRGDDKQGAVATAMDPRIEEKSSLAQP
jgi:hypothetical protein